MTKKSKNSKGLFRTLIYFYVLIILLSLLTVASYTWFSITRTPRVTDLYMFINAKSGLELALEPDAANEDWKLQMDFRDMVDVTTELRPVTWSDRDGCFYAATYGRDGRQGDQWLPLTDAVNANKTNMDGYYVKVTFYARTGQSTKISLSPAVEVDDGIKGSGTYLIGYPDWDSQAIVHSDGGKGAQCAVRIGIRCTLVDNAGEPTGVEPKFYIYEPNSNMHLDGSTEYVQTPSIDGTESLVPEDRLILQTASTWTETYPVQREVVIKDLGEFTTPVELWKLESSEILKIELYIWLEGQDIDCNNTINRAQIMASIQFAGDISGQSGLQPIE